MIPVPPQISDGSRAMREREGWQLALATLTVTVIETSLID